jgi:type VI secretion system protein ImpF
LSVGERNDGDTNLTTRSKQIRDSVDESELRNHLNIDLDFLMNTVRLDSAVSLEDVPYVEKSVLNYGFRDLSNLTRSHQTDLKIAESIRQSLIRHEPRLVPESIKITIVPEADSSTGRVSYEISAEMVADPVDVPLDFVAEVDMGACSMKMKHLRVAS